VTRGLPSGAPERLLVTHLDAAAARSMVDDLVAVYLEVYADADDPFFGEDRYRRQLAGHLSAPGWQAAVGSVDGEVAGYAYGFVLGPGTRWWDGFTTAPPADFTTETGHRTFAISEIMVRAPWQRHGIARRLHDALLGGRTEERATLLVEPENVPAQHAYASWGWHKVAQLRPGWEGAPLFDVLVLRLPAARPTLNRGVR
jgi:ribosomal protein S18 acetylase RimI-like enzyme